MHPNNSVLPQTYLSQHPPVTDDRGHSKSHPSHLGDNLGGFCWIKRILALTSLETWILLVDHEDLTVAANNLGARLLLQRPKRLANLHRALLSLCAS